MTSARTGRGPLIECVPNVSEGRDPAVVQAIVDAVTAAGGRVLDHSLDASHNRAVLTFVAERDAMLDAAFAVVKTARDRIDLRRHDGVHPRIGAADVVPFIPLDGATMDDCVALARELAERVGTELAIPVYLYEHAAQRPERRDLAQVRAGGLTALAASIASDPAREPDAGPRALHPTAGAVAIGARPFLGAFNVYVGDAGQAAAARAIARAIRARDGGLPGVKALGLVVDGRAQVSMNLTDLDAVPLHVAFDVVSREAARHGLQADASELIGLAPQRAIEAAFRDRIRLHDARETVSLDLRVAAHVPTDDVRPIAAAIADLDAHEASGTAAALAAMLASAATRLGAAVHVARGHAPAAEPLRIVLTSAATIERHLHRAAADDAAAWHEVVEARRLPRGTPAEAAERTRAVDAALVAASEVPLRIARLAADIVALAAETAREGDHVTAPDAWAGACIAHGCVHAALGMARGNLAMLADASLAAAPLREATTVAREADDLRARTATAVGA
ncbi:MAG: glutamate formimidoyltransferase, partial [Gemmatimonadaceae bacterium]|nr:glutamate formimidoyltransferase [Gemmatimonadaceae bacterium]